MQNDNAKFLSVILIFDVYIFHYHAPQPPALERQ